MTFEDNNTDYIDYFLDEGISLGGVRSKNEIRTLICYMFVNVNQPLSKETITNSLMEKGLANYFEISSAFDELVDAGNLVKYKDDTKLFTYSENAELISRQLEDTLAKTVRERAIECCLTILEKQRIESENTVKIEKADNGYYLCCNISGGEFDLFSFRLYVPELMQARILKKNFLRNPEIIYEISIAVLTKNKTQVQAILKQLKSVI